ncbi:HAD family hydrolase [Rhodovarius lipocyclicus]|uniref:HAD family hydrolase n=1 Tax=Rhodovarius lipocyclicus TaxID=268410 RepID=UPI00135C19A7|nr:HAD family phosphatase [Rhodovarius lipocyclicus]
MIRPSAVLFDCDGVLVDSEGLVNRILAEELTGRGWAMEGPEARERFLGMAWPDIRVAIETRTGGLPAGWEGSFAHRVARTLATEALPIPGALEALHAVARHLPVAVASNSSREELETKLAVLELGAVFGARVFSFQDVARPKPHPDIYLAAAQSCGAEPGQCVVIEDSVTGVRAGRAAGCRVLGFAHETPVEALAMAGAEVFTSMAALPRLLGV